jgi:hypothetical protein
MLGSAVMKTPDDDFRNGVSVMSVVSPGRGAVRMPVTILELLAWAFQRERVRLDFDPISTVSGDRAQVRSMSAIIAEHERLGCRVDGGGQSPAHPDADMVADAVAHLPESHGGRGMAMRIAELARLGKTPDWYPGAVTRVYPVATHTNRHGVRATTRDARELGPSGWQPVARRNRKGVIVRDAVPYCPVVYRPTACEIAQARRAYLGWWGALRDLRETFRLYGGLSAFEVTRGMPPRAPWEKSS